MATLNGSAKVKVTDGTLLQKITCTYVNRMDFAS